MGAIKIIFDELCQSHLVGSAVFSAKHAHLLASLSTKPQVWKSLSFSLIFFRYFISLFVFIFLSYFLQVRRCFGGLFNDTALTSVCDDGLASPRLLPPAATTPLRLA